MKKSLMALAVLGTFAGTAHAGSDDLFTLKNDDTSLSLYGILDVGYATVNHSYSMDTLLPNQMYGFLAQPAVNGQIPGSQSAAISGGLSDSRWGVKGSKNIQGGMKAIFDLESGINLTRMRLNNAAASLAANSGPGRAGSVVAADSSLNGGMFDRAAWFGVEANWGTLTFGTQNNPMKDAILGDDPVQSDTFSPFGESGTWGGGAGASEQSRMHHSVKYTAKLGSGFDTSLAYQFGNDMRTNLGRTYAARVGYENGPFGMNAAYSNSQDAVIAGTSNTFDQISIGLANISGYEISGHYKVTPEGQIKAGYERFTRSAPSDQNVALGSIWGFGVANGLATPKFASGISQAFSVYWLGGDYDLRQNLNLAVGYYGAKQDAQTGGTNSGTIDVWSAVLKYSLTKALDLYGAFTTNKFSGNAFPSTGASAVASTVTGYGVGARYKF
ncbi:MAG: porin [Burkholderiales bacterium]